MSDLTFLLKQVRSLRDDSRLAEKGDLFFALPKPEALDFSKKALENGALAVVSELEAPIGCEEKWVKVDSVIDARLECAKKFYDDPFSKLSVHAVTGTNGKTTSAFLMREMLAFAGRKTALLGTICNRVLDAREEARLTTPGLLELFAFAKKAVDAGVTDLVMEASSHALEQGRVAGIRFASALFSNLTQDHLDYHKTFENYFRAKSLLFTKYLSDDGLAVLNIDSEYGKRMAALSKGKKVLVSAKGDALAEITLGRPPILTENYSEIFIPKISAKPFSSKLCGEFNIDNMLLVLAWGNSLGIPEEALRKALENVRVPGRFEKVYDANNKHVIVDYAHTPDALERVLKTAKKLCRGKLIVVFGCGGDRDKTKRPLMGAIAEKWSDRVFVTSDNPRTENPEKILEDITAGMRGNYVLEADRARAIREALESMRESDWLVIAGKGHENYQILGTVKHHFDDAEEVRKVLNND